jgi:hypothetical protein
MGSCHRHYMGLVISSSLISHDKLTSIDIVVFRGHTLDHDHTSRMTLEQVVDEWNEHDDTRWR